MGSRQTKVISKKCGVDRCIPNGYDTIKGIQSYTKICQYIHIELEWQAMQKPVCGDAVK